MNFTPEQITKAKAAKSAEELIALAKENGMELSEEEAAKYFAKLNKDGELANEELDNVVGGSWRTYSDDTYNSLGINPNPTHGQYGTYHPLIRAALNSCGISGEFCYTCPFSCKVGPFYYCRRRSREYDPLY